MSSNNIVRGAIAIAFSALALGGCASNPPAQARAGHVRVGEVDLAELRVVPERGQSADVARRDRYECHNWAVEQSGETPRAGRVAEDVYRDRDARNERAERAITGAVIGGALGGILHSGRHHNPNDGVLAGAAVGAAVGASTRDRDTREAEEAPPVQPNGYMRALSACLEGRGYTVAVDDADGESVAHQR